MYLYRFATNGVLESTCDRCECDFVELNATLENSKTKLTCENSSTYVCTSNTRLYVNCFIGFALLITFFCIRFSVFFFFKFTGILTTCAT